MNKSFFTDAIKEDEFVSLPVKILNNILGKNSISNFVRPYKFHNDKGISWAECNDGLCGTIIEIVPRVRTGKSTSEAIETILGLLEDEMYFSINLYGLENNQFKIDDWVRNHKKNDDKYVNKLTDILGAFFEEKTNSYLAPSLKHNMKNFRLFICFKHLKHNVLNRVTSEAFRILENRQFAPSYPSLQSLKDLYYELLNRNDDFKRVPKYSKNKYFNKQLTSSSTIAEDNINNLRIGKIDNETNQFKGKYWTILAIQDISENFDITEFDQKIGANYGAMNSVESNQFKNNFIISLNVVKATKKELSIIGINQKIIKNQIAKDDEIDVKQAKKEHRSIMNKIGGEETFFKTDLIVAVAGNTEEETKEAVTATQGYFKSGTEESGRIYLEIASNVQMQLFLSALPLGLTDEYFSKIQDTPYFWTADSVSQLLPMSGDWQGTGNNILCVGRRGGLIGLDFFNDSGSKNFYMFGTTGSGKSNLLSFLEFCGYSRGGREFSIDVGASQEFLLYYLGGDFLQPILEKPISFNPFSQINKENFDDLIEKYLSFFIAFLYMVGGNKNQTQYEQEQKFIEGILGEIIKSEIKKAVDSETICEVTNIQKRFKELANETKDIRYSDFAVGLNAICENGRYYKFFSGKSDIDLAKSNLACLDITKIQEESDLRDYLVFIITFFFSEAVYKGDNTTQIGFKVDELHRHLGESPRIEKEVDIAFRTYRKHNGSVGTGTQGFNDYIKQDGNASKLGESIITNYNLAFIGLQTQEGANALINSKRFSLNDIDNSILQNMERVNGYREFFVISNQGIKIPVRFIFPPFFLWLVTTDPDEKEKVLRPVFNRFMELTDGNKQESVSLAIDLILNTISNAKRDNLNKGYALKILVENLGEIK
jgi:hypothetical protein